MTAERRNHTTPRRERVAHQIMCLSDDHPGTVHAADDTNPYRSGDAPTCRKADHRALYVALKPDDGYTGSDL